MRGNMTTMVWKDIQDVYMLTNIYNPLAEDNFFHASRSALHYNCHMGYVDR
jgi:hypothetical protein